MINFYPSESYWESEFTALKGYVRESNFYLPRANLIPYYYNPTPFILEADAGRTFSIAVRVRDGWHRNISSETNLITTGATTLVYLRLGLGYNEVEITEVGGDNDRFFATWNTATYATLLYALAKDLYDNVTIDLDGQRSRILANFGSAMVEHLLPYQDMLVDVHVWRVLSARMGLRTSTNQSGRERGVLDWLTALTTTTPILAQTVNDFDTFEYQLPRVYAPEHFGGFDAHIWLPNPCVTEWRTFIRYLNAIPSVYDLVSVSEREVVLDYNGRRERHEFPLPVESACSLSQLIRDLGCLDAIAATVMSSITTRFLICLSGYPVDFDVEPCTLLGLRRLDCGRRLDEGERFDTYDDFDPLGDGWEGYTLSGRLDGLPDRCMDSLIQRVSTPEMHNPCCYGLYGSAVTFLGAQLLEADTPPEPLMWHYLAQFVSVAAPYVTSFVAVPASSVEGAGAILSWTTVAASSVDIDNGVGTGLPPNGSIFIDPSVTTLYTITAYGSGGLTDTATTTMTIIPVDLNRLWAWGSEVVWTQTTTQLAYTDNEIIDADIV